MRSPVTTAIRRELSDLFDILQTPHNEKSVSVNETDREIQLGPTFLHRQGWRARSCSTVVSQ